MVVEKRKGSRMGEEGTLNLTLEEVRHIRTALTRAELEVGPFLGLGNMLPSFLLTRVYLRQYLKADSAIRA